MRTRTHRRSIERLSARPNSVKTICCGRLLRLLVCHPISSTEEQTTVRHECSVTGVIKCLHCRDSRNQVWGVTFDVLHQFVFRIGRPSNQYGTGSIQGFHHRPKEILVFSCVTTPNAVRFMVYMSRRMVWANALLFDLIGIEAEYARLVMVNPHHGMRMFGQIALRSSQLNGFQHTTLPPLCQISVFAAEVGR